MMSHSFLVDGVGSNFETDTPVLTLTELWLYFCEKKVKTHLVEITYQKAVRSAYVRLWQHSAALLIYFCLQTKCPGQIAAFSQFKIKTTWGLTKGEIMRMAEVVLADIFTAIVD